MPEKVNCDYCHREKTTRIRSYERRLRLPGDYAVVRCDRCGLVFMDPRPEEAVLAQVYAGQYYEAYQMKAETDKRIANEFRSSLESARQLGYRSGRVLDAGAGVGGFLKVFKEAGFEVYGTEISPREIQEAKQLYQVDIWNREVLDIEGYDGYFDIVHANHFLEHVRYPGRYFAKINALLKDKGLFIFEVPNEFNNCSNNFRRLFRRDTKYAVYPSLHHLYFYSKSILERYLLANNFEIIAYRGVNPWNYYSSGNRVFTLVNGLIYKIMSPFGYGAVHNFICRKGKK